MKHTLQPATRLSQPGTAAGETITSRRGTRFAVVDANVHGGGVLSQHRSLRAAVLSQARRACADVACDCAGPSVVKLCDDGRARPVRWTVARAGGYPSDLAAVRAGEPVRAGD